MKAKPRELKCEGKGAVALFREAAGDDSALDSTEVIALDKAAAKRVREKRCTWVNDPAERPTTQRCFNKTRTKGNLKLEEKEGAKFLGCRAGEAWPEGDATECLEHLCA